MEQWKIEQVSLAGYSFRVENDEFVFIGDTPTSSELDAIFEEYDALQYQRDRAVSFPELKEQLDLLFHDMTAGKGTKSGEWYKAIAKVKSDNPKE